MASPNVPEGDTSPESPRDYAQKETEGNEESPPRSKSQQRKKRDGSTLRKAPQAPRRFKSSYICFFMAKQQEIKDELGAGASVTKVSKRSSEMWKSLPADQRSYWDEVAAKDKHRYMAEKAMYTGPWQVPWKRAKKDPSAPKRPMSAFLYFSQEKRREIKAKNPEMKNTEVSSALGEMWRNATEEERRPHVERELKERDKYKAEIAKWRDEHSAKLEAQRKAQADQAQYMAQTGVFNPSNPEFPYQNYGMPGSHYGDPNVMNHMGYASQNETGLSYSAPFQPVQDMTAADSTGFDSSQPAYPTYNPPSQNAAFANGKQIMVLGPNGMPQYPVGYGNQQAQMYTSSTPYPSQPQFQGFEADNQNPSFQYQSDPSKKQDSQT